MLYYIKNKPNSAFTCKITIIYLTIQVCNYKIILHKSLYENLNNIT